MTSAITKVSTDLNAILKLSRRLEAEAVHRADDRELPGGDAMNALAPVASIEAWTHKQDAAEERYYAAKEAGYDPRWPETLHEDDDDLPVLQALRFWSESLRVELGMDYDQAWTIASEVNFLRNPDVLAHASDQFGFADMVDDIKGARTRLENLLRDGERAERGVPCMYDECKGARLTRALEPARGKDGSKVYQWSLWRCRKCRRTWTADQYAAMVTAASERAKYEEVNGETWCSYDYAARQVHRPEATIRRWVMRTWQPEADVDELLPIASVCIVAGRRSRFVRLADVKARDEHAKRRVRVAS